MIKVSYSDPELKEVIEKIIGKNFFVFCNEVISQTLNELSLPPKLINQIVILLLPHDEHEMGLAYKEWYAVKLKIQDTFEENTKTLIEETLHLLKPTWDEKRVEKATNKMYSKIYENNTQEISI